jgi:hypothetical protein
MMQLLFEHDTNLQKQQEWVLKASSVVEFRKRLSRGRTRDGKGVENENSNKCSSPSALRFVTFLMLTLFNATSSRRRANHERVADKQDTKAITF